MEKMVDWDTFILKSIEFCWMKHENENDLYAKNTLLAEQTS